MRAEIIADVIAVIAFTAAFVQVLRLPTRAPAIGGLVKYSMLALVSIYLFVSISNVLEHSGIAPAFDEYEDYAEVLFVPLLAYVLYSRSAAERLLRATSAETEARHEHELMTSIVDTTPAGILLADAEGAIVFANARAMEILSPVVVAQLDLGRIVAAAPVVKQKIRVEDGTAARYLSIRAKPIEREMPGTFAVLSVVDVTDRVRNEEQLEEYRAGLERAIDVRTAELLQANRDLHDANEAKKQFYARMSHELRTPLNSIIGFSEIMLKGLSGPLTDEQERQLTMVRGSGTQLLALVNDILDIARIEAGHTAVSLGSVDLAARMNDLVATMQAIAAEHGVDLRSLCDEGPHVTTDADKLDQVVRNLVSNAIKFTDPGGTVTVALVHEADRALLTVEDTGIGIAPEDRERVFEAFAQIETGARPRPEGTGLGLAICQDLCRILGCTLLLDSTPGEGTTFTIVVPREYRGLAPGENAASDAAG